MTKDERKFFRDYLYRSKHYLEFGMGESTRMAIYSPVCTIDAVESDPTFIIKHPKVNVHYANIGQTKGGGHPINNENRKSWHIYYNLEVFDRNNWDLVLIDGRFRVACCLAVLLKQCDPFIMFHDWHRESYHQVLEFTNVIDSHGEFVVLKRQSNIDTRKINQVIYENKYESI